MIARLAGLAVLIPAAAVGVVLATGAGYVMELQRRRTPDLALPVVRTSERAA